MNTETMSSGTVKWFDSSKGYGFIQPDDGGMEVFVHISAVMRFGLSGLLAGDRVSYEITEERGHQVGRLKSRTASKLTV